MSPAVSVILPIYNAEATLPRCLESLIHSEMQDIEVICIDDGSTDRSLEILEAYALKDLRIKVFSKSNGGVSSARNLGLGQATGEYLAFVDADDYVAPSIYMKLYEAAAVNQADMVVCDFYRISLDGVSYSDQSACAGLVESVLNQIFSWHDIALWNRLVRKSMVDILFVDGVQFCEDRIFVANLLAKMANQQKSIAHVSEALYYYDNKVNAESLTKKPQKVKLKAMLDAFDKIYDNLKFLPIHHSYYSFMFDLAFNAYWNQSTYELREEEFKDLFSPYYNGINQYVKPCFKKKLILAAITQRFCVVNCFRWMLLPAIIKDKLLAAW